MIETVSIDGDVAVAKSEPEAENYKELAKQGFRSIVNLQPKDEMQKSPEQSKRQLANEAGLSYAHVPVSAQNMNDDVIDRFREEVDRMPKPVLVHCASGKRAGALAMMYLGVKDKRSGRETLDRARSIGLNCGPQQLDEFVKNYVDRRGTDD